LINEFLNTTEFNYIDNICTQNIKLFKKSFTESEDSEVVISTERTSTFLFLNKGEDKFIRSIEQRASDIVGLSSQNVEPIQIVSYRPGQQFEVHHDAGTLTEEGEVVLAYPKRLVTIFLVILYFFVSHDLMIVLLIYKPFLSILLL
jgi:hypothetical protein